MNDPRQPWIVFQPVHQVSPDVIARLPSMSAAIRLCVEVSGLNEKAIYTQLGIDAAVWSRIKSGQSHFPQDRLNELMDICGNEIPLEWLAWSRGKGLHLLESEAERQMRLKDEEIAELKQKLAWTTELVRGKA